MKKNRIEKEPEEPERPYHELDDQAEEDLSQFSWKEGEWRIGGRYVKPYWRVMLHLRDLDYDILLPGLYKTEKECMNTGKAMAAWVVSKSKEKKNWW